MNNNYPRKGCRDIWNSFMYKDVIFTEYDIPFCPTTANHLPEEIITWEEAIEIYRKNLKDKNYEFFCNAYVCFYLDDYKFVSIWNKYDFALKLLKHFDGVITPDFSTNQDFPDPEKRMATMRMRVYGYWLGKNGIQVINNVRWGTSETYQYCFNGIEKESVVAIGTVGGNPKKYADRVRFENGLIKMMEVLKPKTIIVYGSANYPCFRRLEKQGVLIIAYPSKTKKAFERVKNNEQGR